MKTKGKFLFSIVLMAILLISLSSTTTNAAPQFKDVKPGHWASASIDWAYEQGLTKGFPDGTFEPDKPITEAQLVTMLVRLDCSSPGSFPAEPGEHKASGNYWYLSGKNIPLDGLNRPFAKEWTVKRSTAAQIIAAYKGLDLDKAEAVYYLYTEDLASGRTGKNTLKDFGPNDSLTRAEAVDLLHRVSMTGSCEVIGLKKKASGKDNSLYPLPSNFDENGTVHFPSTNQPSKPPVVTNPTGSSEIDVDKSELIANEVDSTYVTVSFRDCNGNTIPYDRSMSVRVTSSAGAIFNDNRNGWNQKDFSSTSRHSYKTSIITSTDGPDVTVKVTAPKLKKHEKDTLTFELLESAGSSYTACSNQIVTVNLDYVPKAEVRLEHIPARYTSNGQLIVDEKIIATIVLPGGEIVRNFNGYVNFSSTSGTRLSSTKAYFWNGEAQTTVIPNQTFEPLRDEIIAEVIPSSSYYPSELNGVLNETHRLNILHDGIFQTDSTCTAEIPEMAFIIDSSGSMIRNDPKRLRVSKTEELIRHLQAKQNVAADFNASARILNPSSSDWLSAHNSIYKVRESGGTNIGAGMNEAFNKMNTTGSKAAILLTDGRSSEASISRALQIAKDKKITVYTIGLGKETNLNSTLLKQIAKDTGGSYYHITDSIDLGLVYQSILKEITCGEKTSTCSAASQLFDNSSVTFTTTDVFMETDLRETCGDVAKVIVRFKSDKGNIDYELVHRGQNNYRFIRGKHEIADFNLYSEAQFLAFDRKGKQVGAAKTVRIKHK